MASPERCTRMEATLKKIVAMGMLLVAVGGLTPAAAYAGGSTATNIALGLSSFAVFSQLVGGFGLFGPRVAYAAPVYYPAVYAAPAPAYYYYYYPAPAVTYAQPPPPSPAPPTEVVYPHGRYLLRGDGLRVAYQWVWVPNPPPPPPPPAAPPPLQGQQ